MIPTPPKYPPPPDGDPIRGCINGVVIGASLWAIALGCWILIVR